MLKTKKPPGLTGGFSMKIGFRFHSVGERAGVTAIASEVALGRWIFGYWTRIRSIAFDHTKMRRMHVTA